MIFQKDGVKWIYVLELRQKRNQGQASDTYVPTSLTVHRKNANALRIKSDPLSITDVLVENITS